MTIQLKKPKINLREKLAELLNFNEIRDSLSGLGLYLGKDRTNNERNILIRGGADVDDLHITEISAALGDTAVDVFVYNTQQDSDGGAWRSRTSHTSWYNEELNTATRGGRREFPAVAVIVAETDKVTIYDGDDPDLNMWMIFEGGNGDTYFLGGATFTAISILNGKLICVSNGGARECDFISEFIFQRRSSLATTKIYHGYIADRNGGLNRVTANIDSSELIVNTVVNDVAMTVLPNAPIDSETGLPVPTIAVATDGGVSVIKDDGSVVHITSTNVPTIYDIAFTDDYKVMYRTSDTNGEDSYIHVFEHEILSGDVNYTYPYSSSEPTAIDYAYNLLSLAHNVDARALATKGEEFTVGAVQNGAIQVYRGSTDFHKHMTAHTTSSYNTGWMPGDIKLAALSDTKIETVGVDESTELLVDGSGNWIGDFDVAADLDSWELGGDTAGISVVDNKLRIIRSTALTYATIAVNVIEGKKYVVSGTISGSSGNGYSLIRVSTESQLNGTYVVNDMIGDGDHFKSFTATYTGVVYVGVGYADEPGQVDFDNISVKQTGELVTNGTFDVDSDWEKSDHWTISGGSASMPSTSQYKPLYQYNLGLIAGVKYVASVDVSELNGTLKFDTSRADGNGITDTDGIVISSTGIHSFTFVAESDQDGIGVARQSNPASCVIENISIRLAEDDRSVNDNGLQVFGEITKSPVAPGADLVAYSGFSADNYLMQSYNSDLDFGTGDFSIMGWFNAGSSTGIVKGIMGKYSTWDLADPGYSSRIGFNIAIHTDGSFYFYSKSDGKLENTPYENAGASLHTNTWNHFCVNRTGGYIKNYINGSEYSSVISNNINLSIDKSIYIGRYPISNHYFCENGLSLIRISKTAPTADQIAKIYRDEKPLFQDGAQATLYGTSDAVTALAYDDSENLLHVGTASGRSSFNGLKRVDNTTTAVSTAISATEGLVIEQ